jgi:hypothetical protein
MTKTDSFPRFYRLLLNVQEGVSDENDYQTLLFILSEYLEAPEDDLELAAEAFRERFPDILDACYLIETQEDDEWQS